MSGTRRFEQVDALTGEVIQGFVALIKPKTKSDFERHFTMNQETLITMANELSHEQLRVLLALLANLDYENYIQVAQVDVANNIGMQKTHVSRAIKNLILKGVLFEGPKIGRTKSYRLNPNYGWKGSVNNHKKVLKNGFSVIDGGRA